MYVKRTTLFLLGFALIFALIYSLDVDEFARITQSLGMDWFLLILGIQLVMILLMSLRWYVLVRRYGATYVNVLNTSLIGLMINNLTPMSIAGGEPVRAYLISKLDNVKAEKALATVLVELFIALLPALIINILAIVLVFKLNADPLIAGLLLIVGILIFALFAAAIGILLKRESSIKIFQYLLRTFGKVSFLKAHVAQLEEQVDDLFSSFRRGVNATLSDSGPMTQGLMISVIVWALNFIKVYMIFLALGIEISFDALIIVYAILTAVGILPLIPGALGLWEWIGVFLFTFFGIPREAAAAVVLIDRFFFYWLPIGMGSLATLHLGLNIHTILKKQQDGELTGEPQ